MDQRRTVLPGKRFGPGVTAIVDLDNAVIAPGYGRGRFCLAGESRADPALFSRLGACWADGRPKAPEVAVTPSGVTPVPRAASRILGKPSGAAPHRPCPP